MKSNLKGQSMFYGATPFIFEMARELRKSLTATEKILWEKLKEKRLNGFKFRRQHPIFQYIADFYCHELRLVIELDGEIHDTEENIKNDINRDYIMNNFEIEVVRIKNHEVVYNLELVLSHIKNVANNRNLFFFRQI